MLPLLRLASLKTRRISRSILIFSARQIVELLDQKHQGGREQCLLLDKNHMKSRKEMP